MGNIVGRKITVGAHKVEIVKEIAEGDFPRDPPSLSRQAQATDFKTRWFLVCLSGQRCFIWEDLCPQKNACE